MQVQRAEFTGREARPDRASPSGGAAFPTVVVVTGDEHLRRLLEQMIATVGVEVESCSSAEEWLSLSLPAAPGCVLLDGALPGASSLELLRAIGASRLLPIIFIAGRPDVRVAVQAIKAGAIDVLAVPVTPEQLWSAAAGAIELSRMALAREDALRQLRECYASLTPREREVMALVVTGRLNKQIAFELGISEVTVKAHRGQVMRKMKAESLPHLVRMSGRLDHSRASAPEGWPWRRISEPS
jgi:FixJ family two-component response regulator